MKTDLNKLVNSSDAELFKGLGLSQEDAKVFQDGSNHLFGHSPAEQPSDDVEIRPQAKGRVTSDDIRPRN
jgi:hypothetical protein